MAFTSIVISGGAMKIMSAIGCIQYLEEHNIRSSIHNFVGTSAGAILCFFLVLGYSAHDIKTFLIESLQQNHLSEIVSLQNMIDDIYSSTHRMGLSDGSNLVRLFQHILKKKTHKIDITFIDLAKMLGKNLVVCVSNLTKETHEFFDVDTTPEMSVIEALRISCSIPFLFSPVQWNQCLYVDGGMYCNFPMKYFEKELQANTIRNIIGINIRSQTSLSSSASYIEYAMFIMASLLKKFNDAQIETLISNDVQQENNILTLDIEDTTWISFTTFRIMLPSIETIDALIQQGYALMEKRYT